MNKKIDIIYFSLFRWDNPYSSVSLSLGKEFAKQNRVFYLNHPFSVKDVIKHRKEEQITSIKSDLYKGKIRYDHIAGTPEKLISVTPNMTLPINWMNNGGIYSMLSKKNDKKVKNAIRDIIKKYDIKDYIFINCFNPFFQDIIPEEHPPVLNVYQCIDDLSQSAYMVKHGVRLEALSAKNADLVLVTSRELKRLMLKHNTEVYISHNAADTSVFQKALNEKYTKPKEIETVTTKIIGFVGNMDAVRIDYPLIKKIALKFSDLSILLVGPVNSDQIKKLGIDKLDNVILTGSKKLDILPQYLQYMDAVIIPFLCNTLTKSIYPLKINEYLSAGRSVVSTNFSEDIATFKDVIRVAKSHDEFLSDLELAIEDNGVESIDKRQAVALTNTWEARVAEFWKIAASYLQHKSVKS